MTRIEVPNSTSRRGSRRGLRWILILLVVVVAGMSLWSWLTLSWSYSDGERAGVLQKISRKGWLCKTREGELAQYVVAGVSPQIWQFSVRDPNVAAQLDKAVGERVQLHYTEHRGIPTSCFADTSYFVDRVTVKEENPASGAAVPAPGVAPGGVSPSGAPSVAPSTAPSGTPPGAVPPHP
jgi:hypothetical protein